MVNPPEREMLIHLVCRNRVDNNLEAARHKNAKKVGTACARGKSFLSIWEQKRGMKLRRFFEDSRSVGLTSFNLPRATAAASFTPLPLLFYYRASCASREVEWKRMYFSSMFCAVVMATRSDRIGIIAGTFRECVASHIGPLSRQRFNSAAKLYLWRQKPLGV